jgi:hypothetical protein
MLLPLLHWPYYFTPRRQLQRVLVAILQCSSHHCVQCIVASKDEILIIFELCIVYVASMQAANMHLCLHLHKEAMLLAHPAQQVLALSMSVWPLVNQQKVIVWRWAHAACSEHVEGSDISTAHLPGLHC